MAGAAAFDGSVLRSKPRATRRVPFACSTLIGLVNTKLAPRRNALATPRLAFHHRDRKRRLIGAGVARALEEQSRILLVLAIDHDGVKVLCHQLLDCGEGFIARVNPEVKVTENLRDHPDGFFIGTEQQCLVTHRSNRRYAG